MTRVGPLLLPRYSASHKAGNITKIGEEDNLNLLTRASLLERFVTCRSIFLEYFAHLPTQVWRDKKQLSEYVKMCLVHAEPRNEIQARALAAFCSHNKEVTSLLFKLLKGEAKSPGNVAFCLVAYLFFSWRR